MKEESKLVLQHIYANISINPFKISEISNRYVLHCITNMLNLCVSIECSARSLKLSSITNDKINSNGDSSQSSIAELEMLRKQMQQMEDAWICSICIERTRCVAFMCGHSTCAECAQSLRQCPMCRTPIRRKINLF